MEKNGLNVLDAFPSDLRKDFMSLWFQGVRLVNKTVWSYVSLSASRSRGIWEGDQADITNRILFTNKHILGGVSYWLMELTIILLLYGCWYLISQRGALNHRLRLLHHFSFCHFSPMEYLWEVVYILNSATAWFLHSSYWIHDVTNLWLALLNSF